MRRLLIFILVLGVGSAVLWHFENERRQSSTRRPRASVVARPADGSDTRPPPPLADSGTRHGPVEIPDGTAGGHDSEPADGTAGGDGEPESGKGMRPGERVLLRGSLQYKGPPSTDGRPRIDLVAKDTRALDEAGTKYELIDLTVDSFEAGETTEERQLVRSRITAATAHVDLRTDELGLLKIREDLEAILFTVVVERLRGSPLAPLTLEAPRLHAVLDTEELHSIDDDLVTFHARDMRGSGRGLDAIAGAGILAFNQGADVSVDLGDGRQLRIVTAQGGALAIVDETPDDGEEDDPHLVRVRASDGVQLFFQSPTPFDDPLGSEPPTTVSAASVDILLIIGDGDSQPLIRTARADGSVTIRQGRDVYRGDTARIFFNGPTPSSVILEENPHVTYILPDVDGGEMRIDVTGQGPVTSQLYTDASETGTESAAASGDEPSRMRFVFVGPGRIEVKERGLKVTFENEARGHGLEDQSEGIVLVSGDVHVETPEGTLESESILATLRKGDDLRLVSEGPTRVVSRGGALRGQYRALADGGLSAHLVGDKWFIDRADGFHGESSGAEPHRLDAATVTEVDLEAQTLKAHGDVKYQSLWGEVRAQDAWVRSENSIQLTGSVDDPVALDLAPEGALLMAETERLAGVRTGFVRAVTLDLQEGSFRANGRVAAQFETGEGVWSFDADTLRVQRSEPAEYDAQAPEGAGELRVEGDFVREARFDGPEGRVRFKAKRLIVEGVVLDSSRANEQGTRLDPEREVRVRALGDIEVVLESLGVGPDPVIARWTLKSNTATLVRGQRELGGAGGAPFNLVAEDVTECVYEAQGRRAELSADEVEIDATLGAVSRPAADVGTEREVSAWGSSLVATGSVDMNYTNGPSDPTVRGRGDTLVLLDGKRGQLEAAKGKRVRVTGRLPGDRIPYTLTAKTVWFTDVELRADTPIIRLSHSFSLDQLGGVPVDELSADLLIATEETLVLEGHGRAVGKNPGQGDASVSFKRLSIDIADLEEPLKGPRRTIGPQDPVPAQEGPNAHGIDGVELIEPNIDRGDGTKLKGDLLLIDQQVGLFLQGRPAHLEAGGASIDTEEIKILFDDYLIFAGRGAIRAPGRNPGESMTFEFGAIDSRVVGDEILITISAPRISWGAESARADYIAFFVDRARWKAKGDSVRIKKRMPDSFPGDDEATLRDQPNFLAEMLFEIQSEEFGSYLRALYMEGSIEIARADKRAVKGSRLYINLDLATAWIEDVEIVYPLTTRGKQVPLRIRTDRLATDENGRLVAEGATLTTCNHDEPHFVVRTKLFSLQPRKDGRWRFGAKGNRLRFQGGIAMPLPSIGNVVLDEDFGVEGFENEAGEVTPLRDIGVAQTARFGATLGAAFRFDIGKVGRWIAERIGMDSSKLRGKWDADARYLWDRGPLLGLGLQIREHEPGDDPDEDFRVDTFIGGIPDDGVDRGTVRVPVDERDTLRLFGYVRSRYPIVRGEWIDIAFASQTDAGIQSEFYEGDYLTFEQRDTFVRWRKSFGADYLTAGVQKRVDSFRSQKEELPSFYAYRGERRVGTFTGLPVLWGGNFEAGYFKRREGDPGSDLFSDLPAGAQVGIGDGEAARADLNQRVSIPIRTDIAAIRATPFAEFQGTAWSNSLDGGDDPLRGAVLAGVELSTTLHKVTDNGYLSAIAPRVSARTDVWYDQSGGSLIPFDRTEAPIDGNIYEAGLRMLWQRPATFENLDIDLRTILRQDRENGIEDVSEFATLAEYITRYGGGEGMIGLRHDARYDMETSETNYSRSTFGVRPNQDLLLQASYSQARTLLREELYENVGARVRWTVDPKWEIEAGYVYDLQENRQLLTDLILRRFSHDFVLDIGFQDRAGEGGITFGFRFSPLLGWKRRNLGMLDR